MLFGAVASLIISPLAVPLIYYMTHAGQHLDKVSKADPKNPAAIVHEPVQNA